MLILTGLFHDPLHLIPAQNQLTSLCSVFVPSDKLEAGFHLSSDTKKPPAVRMVIGFVILPGFEPGTHSLEGCCSVQLSYRTDFAMQR